MAQEHRVFGPPGCGKTTWISRQIRKLVPRYGEEQISVCSLTNTAVREVVGRDLNIPPENISTLHSRCKRALMAPAPAESRVGDFLDDNPRFKNPFYFPEYMVRSSIKSDPDSVDDTQTSSSSPNAYQTTNLLRQRLIPVTDWPREVVPFHHAWTGWQKEQGILDFTGWLEQAIEQDALPYQDVVFCDEAQDHTPLQIKVIRNWNAKHRILVGDDDQNLYEWTGAVPDQFFYPELPPEMEKVLSQSYRVPRAVHAVANQWVQQLSRRKSKEYYPRDHEGSVTRGGISLGDFESHLPYGFVDSMTNGKSHMLLTSSAYMLDNIIDHLMDEGIPFHNPYRTSNRKWNPLYTIGPLLENYLTSPTLTGTDFLSWGEMLASKDVFIKRQKEAALRFAELRGDREITLNELATYIRPYFLNLIEDRDLELFKRYRLSTSVGAWDYALKIYERSQTEWSPRIVPGTIHSVKGAQADNVILFPDLSQAAAAEYSGANRDRLLRLMYVGMTRSRDTLTLATPTGWRAVTW